MFEKVGNLAVHRGWNVASRVADSVVGDSVLREVVSSNFLASVARADEISAFSGELGVFFVDFLLKKSRAQNSQGLFFILDLGFFVLVRHDGVGRQAVDCAVVGDLGGICGHSPRVLLPGTAFNSEIFKLINCSSASIVDNALWT